MGHHWLIQEGAGLRSITGSFNERGIWNPAPVGGSITSFQDSLGLNYFPDLDTSVSVQVPFVANRLAGATWGPMGSINPTDTPAALGSAMGDIAVQATHKLYEGDTWALSGWAGVSLPSGNVAGDPSSYSGSGVWSGEAGLTALMQQGDWEWSANLGYQQPFGLPPVSTTSFYIGQALVYTLEGDYRLNSAWRLGLGLDGYGGIGKFGAGQLNVLMGKSQIVPSVQYAWNMSQGVKLSLGVDPTVLGTNALTGTSASIVYYQYVR